MMRALFHLVPLAATLALGSCAPANPIRTTSYPAPAQASESESSKTLVVMLPGKGDEPEDYDAHGFLKQMRAEGHDADVVAVDAHFGYYRSRTLLPRLRETVFEPAKGGGYDSIWLVGISMGGLGALLAAREFSEQVDGVVLMSPYVGSGGTLAKISAAGGPAQWQPPQKFSKDYTVELWRWLKAYADAPDSRPPMFLGYGSQEESRGHEMLATLLPADRVIVEPGGHRWTTWEGIWPKLLAQPEFMGE